MGELKTTIRSWIFGMGPLDFEKVKSICLIGPPGCGKKHIIYAVAAEIGAVVFNLSRGIASKYKDNMPYFVQLVTKMATILQPTVLFINGAHKPFIKIVFLLRGSYCEHIPNHFFLNLLGTDKRIAG